MHQLLPHRAHELSVRRPFSKTIRRIYRKLCIDRFKKMPPEIRANFFEMVRNSFLACRFCLSFDIFAPLFIANGIWMGSD
jgi:hypothetical protein